MAELSIAAMAARYTRRTTVASIMITAAWHLGNDLPTMITGWSDYRWPWVSAAGWVAYSVIVVACAVPLLRGDVVRHPWLVVTASVIVSVVVAVAADGQVTTLRAWAMGSCGWLAVLAAWRRGLAPLTVFFVSNILASYCVLLVIGQPTRMATAQVLMANAGAIALQLGFIIGARTLTRAVDWAAAAATERAETQARRAAAEAAHQARRDRYTVIQQTAARVIDDLATGVADPGDPAVQRSCAVAAARLRRLFLETEDVPYPLLHELRGCVDVAERRGVLVELRTVGAVAIVPVDVRRALVEPLISVLANTRTTARVTLAVSGPEVTLSVLADASDAPPIASPHHQIHVEQYREEDQLWVQTQWSGPSQLPSSKTTTSSSRAYVPGSPATQASGPP